MNRPLKPASPKRATNVTLSQDLVEEAKALGINLSQACEAGLAERVADARAEHWKRENKEAIASWNRYVQENGMPYDEFRQG
ncbi:type II toxin-antitoxin system CcdA family antitoxin [Sphingomonas lacunae]|uniref:Type II toxin-antitoxin system CcdA family antitoxin n=1 Tax=Sphingomonas lacunae TaxID=2698828 RepID=A0A6M4AYJ7_9SPHN|nr:type II toxin-antitoxin system CcdA family antitoxin [Sphingomonas lacunae]QJQ33430.1 type II toxin-antitoxin system CcdA family antitoxin [Sphingomonas lacunae]